MHRHAHGDTSYRYAARDGVTSAFELEIGTADVRAWYRMVGPARLINFGVAAGHIGARMQVLGDKGFLLPAGPGRGPGHRGADRPDSPKVSRRVWTPAAWRSAWDRVHAARLARGEAGVFRLAAKHGAFVHAHLGGGLAGLKTLLGLAGETRAPLHIAHINSTAGDDIGARSARSTTPAPAEGGCHDGGVSLHGRRDADPIGAVRQLGERGRTSGSAGCSGRRLVNGSPARRSRNIARQGGSVISHRNTEDALRVGIADPLPMFASDGGRDAGGQPDSPARERHVRANPRALRPRAEKV